MEGLYLSKCLPIQFPVINGLDIGAMLEGAPRYQTLVEQQLMQVSGFEPDPEQFARLTSERSEQHFQWFPHFLGDGEMATFYQTRYPGCSSLYEPDPDMIDLFVSIGALAPDGNFFVQNKQSVQTKRLDDIPLHPIDYIKIDVQGGELDILKHGQETLKNVCVIECEVEFVALYKNQPLFGDIQLFMQQQGFILHKLIDVGGRCFKPMVLQNPFKSVSQLLWADAIFVRDFTQLENLTDEQLLKQALVMNDVYHSYDYTHFLLQAFDTRHQSTLAASYMQQLKQQKNVLIKFMNLKEYA